MKKHAYMFLILLVTLTLITSGCTEIQTDIDDDNNSQIMKPTADTGGPYEGNCGIPIMFDCSDSIDNDENNMSIDTYRWDWNDDGVWDTGWLDFSDPNTSHSYSSEFDGSARLEVMDDEGETDTDSVQVTVDCWLLEFR